MQDETVIGKGIKSWTCSGCICFWARYLASSNVSLRVQPGCELMK